MACFFLTHSSIPKKLEFKKKSPLWEVIHLQITYLEKLRHNSIGGLTISEMKHMAQNILVSP